MDDLLLRFCNQNTKVLDKGLHSPLPNQGIFGIAKNYRGITLTSMVAKVYNVTLLSHFEPEMEKILRKNENGFRRNRSTTSQIMTIRQIIHRVRTKDLLAAVLFIDFSQEFHSIPRGKMEQIFLVYCLPNEIVASIIMLNKNMKAQFRSLDGDTDFFDIVTGVLQGDTLIVRNLPRLKTSIDLIIENGFTHTHTHTHTQNATNRHHPAETITDPVYASCKYTYPS